MSKEQFLALLRADGGLTDAQKSALVKAGIKVFVQRVVGGSRGGKSGGGAVLLQAVMGDEGPMGMLKKITGGGGKQDVGGARGIFSKSESRHTRTQLTV